MIHFYSRLVTIPILIFTAVLLLLHAQPYEDHELREFLLMRGCSTPCFMGIIPGETRYEAAIKLLEESHWVEKITYQDDTNIQWAWNGQQPRWINPTFEGRLSLYQNKVNGIQLNSRILLGNILINPIGSNRLRQIFKIDSENIVYGLDYPDSGLYFAFKLGCNDHDVYLQPLYINVIRDFSPFTTLSPITLDGLKRLHQCT